MAEPVEPKPVADGLARSKPSEIVTPEAEAEANSNAKAEAEAEAKASAKEAVDAKEKAEGMRLIQEVDEPQRAPLKVMGEKKALNDLADYGEYYSASDE